MSEIFLGAYCDGGTRCPSWHKLRSHFEYIGTPYYPMLQSNVIACQYLTHQGKFIFTQIMDYNLILMLMQEHMLEHIPPPLDELTPLFSLLQI